MKAYLVLCDGAVFEGERIGAARDSVGELVFTTGSVGYLETLTDPSYAGQIIMQTFPLIGNYGVIPEDFEGKCACRGYVVRELCDTPSNFRSQEDLDTFPVSYTHLPFSAPTRNGTSSPVFPPISEHRICTARERR